MSTKTSEYRKRTVLLLFALLFLRFWLGQTFELTPDEAYSWAKGRVLDWAYWDQGFLTPFLTYFGTLFFGQTELGLRWVAAAIFTGTGFVLFYTTREWFGARAAFWTVLTFAVLPVFSAPLLLLTDTTVSVGLMAVTLFIYSLMLKRPQAWTWALGGLISGLGLMASLWNLWWIVGLLFLTRTRWRHKLDGSYQQEFTFRSTHATARFQPWYRYLFISGVLLGLVPFLLWQQRPQLVDLQLFRPYRFFGFYGSFSLLGALNFFAGQLVALTPPFLSLLILFSRRFRVMAWHEPRWWFLGWIGLPGLIALTLSSFWQTTSHLHTAVFYLPLLPLAIATILRGWDENPVYRRWVIALATLSAAQGILTLIPATSPWVWRDGFYLRTHFKALAQEITGASEEYGATFVLADDPRTASAVRFYLLNQPFVYVVRGEGVHSQYDFWAGYEDYINASAVLITTAHTNPPIQLGREFQRVKPRVDPLPPELEDAGWKLFFCEHFGGMEEPLTEETLTPPPLPRKNK